MPKRFLGLQVEVLETLTGFGGGIFHRPESAFELEVGAAQRAIGVDVELARQVGDGEQHVAQFVFHPVGVGRFQFILEFGQFLPDLGQHRFQVRPVESCPCGAFLQLDRAPERRQRGRDPVDVAGHAGFFALGGLDALPALGLGVGIDHRTVPEHMGMAPDQLVGDRPGNLVEVERPDLARQAGVKDNLEQQVAQFVLQVIHIVALDRIGHLVCLLDGIRRNRAERLLQVPRAAALGVAQAVHDFEQAVDRSGNVFGHGAISCLVPFSSVLTMTSAKWLPLGRCLSSRRGRSPDLPRHDQVS